MRLAGDVNAPGALDVGPVLHWWWVQRDEAPDGNAFALHNMTEVAQVGHAEATVLDLG